MKNILIIGANGFTGRRILNDLSVNPIYHVTGCSLRDDICPGKDFASYVPISGTKMKYGNYLKNAGRIS